MQNYKQKTIDDQLLRLNPGDGLYVRTMCAVFLAGVTAFISMYCPQGILPAISENFHVSASVADLTVSLTTGMLALSIFPISALSEQFGRRTIIICSAFLSSLIGLLTPLSPNIYCLLCARAMQGIALAGVPAVVVAYISEEFSADSMSRATGIYIAGTGFGGLVGRFIPSCLLRYGDWSIAWLSSSLLAALATVICWKIIPES